MKELIGIGASRGAAVGAIHHFDNATRAAGSELAANAQAELARFDEARHRAIEMLGELYCRACEEIGVSESMIFQIHQLLLADQDYTGAVKTLIFETHCTAEYAVQQAGAKLAQMFTEMDNAYMKARGADMLDISNRIMRLLRNEDALDLSGVAGRVILAAEDLLPSEMIALDRDKVLAVVTAAGSEVSHSAILARTMKLPAVMGLGMRLHELEEGVTVLVDGQRGVVLTAPDEATLASYGFELLARG